MERHCNILLLISQSESSSMSLDEENPLLVTLALPPLKLIEISLLRLPFLFNWPSSRQSSLNWLFCLSGLFLLWKIDNFFTISPLSIRLVPFGSTTVRQRRQIWLNFGGTLYILRPVLKCFTLSIEEIFTKTVLSFNDDTEALEKTFLSICFRPYVFVLFYMNKEQKTVTVLLRKYQNSFFNYHINPFTTMLCSLLFTALIIKAIVRAAMWDGNGKNDTKQLNFLVFFHRDVKLVFTDEIFCLLLELFNHTIKKTEIHELHVRIVYARVMSEQLFFLFNLVFNLRRKKCPTTNAA